MSVETKRRDALVQALTLVLVNRGLTADDKQSIASLLDEELARRIQSGDEDAKEAAADAVAEALKRRRRMQGVASRTALKREMAKREISSHNRYKSAR